MSAALSLFAQGPAGDTLIVNNNPLILHYNFVPKDTLIYRIVSFDSIIVDYGNALLKNRFEKIRIICDSIGSNDNYYLRQKFTDFFSYESSGDSKGVEHNTTSWLGREVWFEVDSLGNRFNWGYLNDTSLAALCPGGAFQPHLIFPIQKSTIEKKKSWLVSSLDALPENGNPAVALKQNSLFRAMGIVDTLNDVSSRIEYVKTGQGSYKVADESDSIKVTSIINGYGVLDISMTKHIPLHYTATIEEKLTMTFKNNITKQATHLTNSFFTLEDIRTYVAPKVIKPLPKKPVLKKYGKKAKTK